MKPDTIYFTNSPENDYFTIEYGEYKFSFEVDHLFMVDNFEADRNEIDLGYYPVIDREAIAADIIYLYEDDALTEVAAELAEM